MNGSIESREKERNEFILSTFKRFIYYYLII